MKPSKSQLYIAMGELVYAVAKSKGLSLQPDSALFPQSFCRSSLVARRSVVYVLRA